MIAHVFPYHYRQLGQDQQTWLASQFARWPLAAVIRSRLARVTSVHVIGDYRSRLQRDAVEVRVHPSLPSGPRWRDWGEDWSWSLGRFLRGMQASDTCIIHLNDYHAARYAQHAAWPARIVLVYHGRGVGSADDHSLTADKLVVLSEEARRQLIALGHEPSRICVTHPSIDRQLFVPSSVEAGQTQRTAILGFVGRVDDPKGAPEMPRVLNHLAARGIAPSIEAIGAVTPERVAALSACAPSGRQLTFFGERHAEFVAERMRRWRLLLLPSRTEGYSIVALEALASGLPVAAVEGVLPAELEKLDGIVTAPRDRYP